VVARNALKARWKMDVQAPNAASSIDPTRPTYAVSIKLRRGSASIPIKAGMASSKFAAVQRYLARGGVVVVASELMFLLLSSLLLLFVSGPTALPMVVMFLPVVPSSANDVAAALRAPKIVDEDDAGVGNDVDEDRCNLPRPFATRDVSGCSSIPLHRRVGERSRRGR
jgi:hypothetical protein